MSNLTYSAHLFCEALGEGGQHSPKAFMHDEKMSEAYSKGLVEGFSKAFLN